MFVKEDKSFAMYRQVSFSRRKYRFSYNYWLGISLKILAIQAVYIKVKGKCELPKNKFRALSKFFGITDHLLVK